MVDKVKPLALENPSTGGTESFPTPTEVNPTEDHLAAKGISFEGTDTTLVYGDSGKMTFTDTEVAPITLKQILDRISTSASPGFGFGRSGNVNTNTWLLNESVPSNLTGRRIPFNNTTITKILVSNENANTFTIQIYEHDGTTYTLLTSQNIVATRAATFSVNIAVTTNKELAVKLTSGSAKNLVVGLILAGTL
jgi:hypothetical protein